MEAPSPKTMYVAPSWIEAHCIVPDGFRRGQRFQPYDYQLLYWANFYLVKGDAPWIPENPVLGPAFVYRGGLLVAPQKIGKSPGTAAHCCLEGVGPALFAGWAGKDEGYVCGEHGCGCGWEYPYEVGEPKGMPWPSPLVQITAFSQDQTDNIYDVLRPMIELGPLADLIPNRGEEFMRLPQGGKSRIETVTSGALSRLGARTTFVPQTELGIWTTQNKMQRVADTQHRGVAGMGGRWSAETNAWDPAEKSSAQLIWESTDPTVYKQFVQPPKNLSYANKRDRAKIHRIVYPPDVLRENGGHVDLDSIEAIVADLITRDAPQAMRFFGNILVAGAGAAVDPIRWDQLARPKGQPAAGTSIGIGFDGSINQDATFLVGCTSDLYSFLIRAWIRPAPDSAEMLEWLAAHPSETSWKVVRSEVHEELARAHATWKVGRQLCDSPKWQSEIEDWQRLYGDEVVLAVDTNQHSKFALSVDRWLVTIAEGTHTHDGDEQLGAHVKAAHKKRVRPGELEDDGRTKYVLVKGGDGRRMDGAIADVLAVEAATTMPPPKKASVYERRGITFIGGPRTPDDNSTEHPENQ